MKTFQSTHQKTLQYLFHATENCYLTSDQLASMLKATNQTRLPFCKRQHYLPQPWSDTSKQAKHCQIKRTEADEGKSID